MIRKIIALEVLLAVGCSSSPVNRGSPDSPAPNDASGLDGGTTLDAASGDGSADAATPTAAALPLVLVADVDLPGRATRFDYQDIDPGRSQLVVAHMNDGAVLILDLASGAVKKQLTSIPTARGVAVADEVGIIFVTSSPNQLVLIDNGSLNELRRVTTGSGPDGVAWDPVDQIVGVSDQGDGALSLISGAGSGARRAVPLGVETGNVVYDQPRGRFWITAVAASGPDHLVAVDPASGSITASLELPGCSGAHGLRLHPDGQSAFIACEGNDMVARVELGGAHAVATAPSGAGPDVLSIDLGLGWLYVSAESGDLTVFDIRQPGVALVGHDQPGANAHSVAADSLTHRVFFPLMVGPHGTPVLRIMRPAGT